MTIANYKIYVVKPKAATNLCLNPSFETNTTGWAAYAGGTLARSSDYQRAGAFSLRVTPDGINNYSGVSYPITLSANTDYVLSLHIKGYLGVVYNIMVQSSAGTHVNYDYIGTGRWDRIVDKTFKANATSFTVYVWQVNSESGTHPFYIDGVQIEAGTVSTTYLDGDMTGFVNGVKEYGWNGTAHASSSYRLATTRSGGELIDLSTYCRIIDIDGLGIAPISNRAAEIVSGGERFIQSDLMARFFTLNVAFYANDTTIGTVMTNRKEVINLVKPDLTPYNQPLVLRYQGLTSALAVDSEPVDIICQYVDGLSSAKLRYFEQADITFRMSGTTLSEAVDTGEELGFTTSVANANYIIKRDTDGNWAAIGSGLTGTVNTMIQMPNGDIIIGGEFLNGGGIANADNIIKWDGTAWSALGAGLNGGVNGLTLEANGNLIVCGNFTNAGGVANADYIARWNGTAFSALSTGTGLNGAAYGAAINSTGKIYVGGNFSSADGVANTGFIASLNGTTWGALGAGLSSTVVSIAIDRYDNVYAGGRFLNAGGIAAADRIAKWNGTAWSALGTGLNMEPYSIAFDINGDLIAGGDFTNAGGVAAADCIARWNGKKWSALGDGLILGPTLVGVYEVSVDKNGDIYAGGNITGSGSSTFPSSVAVYHGGIWIPIDIALPAGQTVYSIMITANGDLYLGYDVAGVASSATVTASTVTSAASYPIVTVTGPGLLWQLKNYTTGRVMYFNNLTLLAGETVTIDLRPGKISIQSSTRGNMLSYVLPGSNYDWFLLPGSNNVSAFMTSTTSASKIKMVWRNQLHGLDGASL